MFDYFAITLSYHTLLSVIWQPYTFCCCILAASDNIYRFILYGVWNAWPLFFPWRFSILLGKWGPPLLFFFWVFFLLFSVQCMCVGFSVHVAQQDFYYFKGYQFGDWYLSNFRFFGLSQGPKVMKNVPVPPTKSCNK